jgi:prevent-host-death family protein
MPTTIPLRDLRNHNAQIVARVAAGESFVVTRDGVPVADVTPHLDDARRPPRFAGAASLADFLAPSKVDSDAWLAEVRASDEVMTDDPFDTSA